MTAARVYLILSAGVYLVLAAFFLLSPEEWAVKASLVADTPAGRAEIRAMYGGLELGIGAWLLVCAARERLVEVGLLTVAFTLGGLGTGRTLGLLGDPAGFSAHAPFLASEVTGTVGALVVLWWLRRSAT
ncbi:MAG: DUF4345 family protein [Alphaproteobacteria bacterium]|nr:DUF4345 family protein [Alphaproteobacteria bacterium]